MTFNQYQKEAFKTALPATQNITYMMLGLTNEAGEAAGKLKKVMRGDESIEEAKEKIASEILDVIWYAAGALTVLGLSMDDYAKLNLAKLKDRQARGVIQGNGDLR